MSLTSSGGERAHECLASVVLPHHPHSGIEAEYGNENHAKAEREDLHPKHKAFLSKLTRTQTEVSYVIDTAARTIQHTGHRRHYGKLLPFQVGTTPDVVGWLNDVPVSIDWKSRKRVTSPARNWQVRCHALAMSVYSQSNVIAGIGYLDDGYLDLVSFGPIELAAAWADWRDLCERYEKIKKLYAENPSMPLTPRRGEWCTFCPALLSCPAQRQALTLFRNTADVTAMVAAATDEEIEDARLTKRALEKMLEQFEQAVKARAEVEPIKLRSGKVLKLIECKRQSDDVYLMKERLRQHGDNPEEFKRTITYSQLKECKP